MKIKLIIHFLVVFGVIVSLLSSGIGLTSVHAEVNGGPIKVTESMLNKDGTFKSPVDLNGVLDLNGWSVMMDPLLGPVFSPAATSAGSWSALTANNFCKSVNALAVIGTDLYVGGGGDDSCDPNNNLHHISRYNTVTHTWYPLAHNGLSYDVYALTVIGTDLYVGGAFTATYDSGINLFSIAKYDTLTGTWSALNHNGLIGRVRSLTAIGTDLYVGGEFAMTKDKVVKNLNLIARYDTETSTWYPLSEKGLEVACDDFPAVYALTSIGTDLYVGGCFEKTWTGVTQNLNGIARYDTTTNTWYALNDGGLYGEVAAIYHFGNDLYVGGWFTQSYNGATTHLNNVARYNTTGGGSWYALANNGLDDGVDTITAIGTDLYMGGYFTQSKDGVTTGLNKIAKYNTTTNTWSALADNGLDNKAYALQSIGNDLYVGGEFQHSYGGAAMNLNWIARYAPSSSSSLTVESTTLQTSYLGAGPSSLSVTFSGPVNNPGNSQDPDAVTNPYNYKIINKGPNHNLDTTSCAAPLGGDDSLILPINVSYTPNKATVTLSDTLPPGNYTLFVCATTSIVDTALNPINGGVDLTYNFSVSTTTAASIPATGFAPNRVTDLPKQTAAYTQSDLWMEIPKLGLKMDIVDVPLANNKWDITWLGQRAGWLEGSAFPTREGNSVLVGHVWNADNTIGPFDNIDTLSWGDKVIIHAWGAQYVYEVRTEQQVGPGSTAAMLKHETLPWVTLVTCRGYDEPKGDYTYRILVRAVLVEMK